MPFAIYSSTFHKTLNFAKIVSAFESSKSKFNLSLNLMFYIYCKLLRNQPTGASFNTFAMI